MEGDIRSKGLAVIIDLSPDFVGLVQFVGLVGLVFVE
jgi:hypothetical protein